MDTYLTPWKKYATFSGRAPRKEFWTFYLVNTATVLFLSAMFGSGVVHMQGVLGFRMHTVGAPAVIFSLAVFLPTVAVIVRRLHDAGRTGWWVLLGLFPVIGGLIVMIMMLFDSQSSENEYGPNPKENVA